MVKPRDNVELIGVNLMRKVAERTNDQVADGTSTSIILAHRLISEGVKAVTTGADRMETIKGVERTVGALVKELKPISRKVKDFVDVIKINTRNNDHIGLAVARAKSKVGSEGVVGLEIRKMEDPVHLLKGLHVGCRHLFPLLSIVRTS